MTQSRKTGKAGSKAANTTNAANMPTSTAAEDMATATATGKDTVTVALNRAQGVKFILGDGRRVEVFGNAVHLRGKEMGELPTGGAFGLTTIPAEDWEEIRRRYGDTRLFTSGRIFAQATRANVLAQARERADTRHGLEPFKGTHTEEARASGE